MDTDARQRMAPPMPLRRRVGANAAIATALVASARLLLKTAEPCGAGLRKVAPYFFATTTADSRIGSDR
jgi:hypothetical protein